MASKYKNPPLVEALCEFQFVPSQSWDLTVLGLIYEKVKGKFPHRQQQTGIGVQFKATEKGLEHVMEPAPPRMQFLKEDRKALIQVAPDLLVINQLSPYQAWVKFKPMISEALQIYKEVANPKGFRRIGLRYINRIDIKAKLIKIEEYLNFYPRTPEDMPQYHTNFISRVEITYTNNRDRMLVTASSIPSQNDNTTSVILDIDYIMGTSEAVASEDLEEWIEQAHTAIEKAFESCITDKSRILFGEGK